MFSNCRSKTSHSSQTIIMTWWKLSWVGLKDEELRHLTLTTAFLKKFYKIWVMWILWISTIKLSKTLCAFYEKKIYIFQSEDNYEKQKRDLKNAEKISQVMNLVKRLIKFPNTSLNTFLKSKIPFVNWRFLMTERKCILIKYYVFSFLSFVSWYKSHALLYSKV